MKNKDTNKRKLLAALVKHRGLVLKACKTAKLSRSVHYKYYHEDPEYKEAVDNIMEAQVEEVEDKLNQLIDANNTAAVIFYLKNKSKSFRPQLEISGKDGAPIQINAMFNVDLIKEAE